MVLSYSYALLAWVRKLAGSSLAEGVGLVGLARRARRLAQFAEGRWAGRQKPELGSFVNKHWLMHHG